MSKIIGTLGCFIREERTTCFSDPHLKLSVTPYVYTGTGKPCSLDSWDNFRPVGSGEWLHVNHGSIGVFPSAMRVRDQGGSAKFRLSLYGLEPEIQSTGLTAYHAKGPMAAIARIDRAMRKMSTEEGYSDDPAVLVTRFARAIGAKFAMWNSRRETAGVVTMNGAPAAGQRIKSLHDAWLDEYASPDDRQQVAQ